MNLPNALTILRIFFVPLLVAALVQETVWFQVGGVRVTNDWLSLAIFLVAAFTDLLDGYLARSPLGTRDATQATNQGVCWVEIPATTTAAGALTFRVCKLGATESGGVVTGGS